MQAVLSSILTKQAKRFIRKQRAKVVVVSGSVGKTSTTQAIATVLATQYSVKRTLKNYNTTLGVPCSVFGSYLPSSLKNPFAWLWLLLRHEVKILFSTQKIDAFVLELGTDAPGDIAQFAWLAPDVAVVTAVAPEHMEFFGTLDAVAAEELSVAQFSERTYINKHMVASAYLQLAQTDELYNYDRDELTTLGITKEKVQVIGEHSLDALAASVAVAKVFGMDEQAIVKAVAAVTPQPGRMRPLRGIKNSTIIDDTYNASPEASIAAIKYLQAESASQRIALLGNMNELGEYSEQAHGELGEACDPKKLALVVTLGKEANTFTAAAAEKKGCNVVRTSTPYDAAEVIRNEMKDGAVILCKGSQNGVFAEEAVKALLADPNDARHLVRQDPFWLKKKQASFTTKNEA